LLASKSEEDIFTSILYSILTGIIVFFDEEQSLKLRINSETFRGLFLKDAFQPKERK